MSPPGGSPSRYTLSWTETLGPERTDIYNRRFTWNLYHIENYLLEPAYIGEALGRVNVLHPELSSMGKIDEALRQIAKGQIGKLVLHKLTSEVHSTLRRELKLGADPASDDIGTQFHESVVGAVDRMKEMLSDGLGVEEIRLRTNSEAQELADSLETDEWTERFRGRDVLKAFVGKYVSGMRYEYFRDLIISQMVAAGYQPPGMKAILDQIVAD